MNILSFDIEEWYLEKIKGGNRYDYYSQLDTLYIHLLDFLEELDIQATFFCLGKMASEFPEIIKGIHNRGHDIGCHSNEHKWLTKLSPEEMFNDTKIAKDQIEQLIGKEIVSYRAPAFTITPQNCWSIQVLSELGFQIDSSIFPISHEIGGYPDFPEEKPCIINYHDYSIKEFPIISMNMLGRKFAYSGGGYFRLMPYYLINQRIHSTDYFIGYFHMSDLLQTKIPLMTQNEYESYFKERGTFWKRYLRYIKCNIGVSGAIDKLEKLLTRSSFCSMAEATELIDWNKVLTINV